MVKMPLGGSEAAASSNPTLEWQIRDLGEGHTWQRDVRIMGRGCETSMDPMMEEIVAAEATRAAEELDVRDQGTGQANSLPLDVM